MPQSWWEIENSTFHLAILHNIINESFLIGILLPDKSSESKIVCLAIPPLHRSLITISNRKVFVFPSESI